MDDSEKDGDSSLKRKSEHESIPDEPLAVRRSRRFKRRLLGVVGCLGILGLLVNLYLIRRDPLMDQEAKTLLTTARQLTELAEPIGPVVPGDWLDEHFERGQSFRQYLASYPVALTPERNKIYVLPLGDFTDLQNRIVGLSAEFLALYYTCEVSIMKPIGLNLIPGSEKRIHPREGMRQLKSTYILSDVLKPRLPDDAAALIAFTATDLYPQDDWNFVYGQASLRHRVGVWSLFRNGDPRTEFKTVLLRTLKTASHETGHMFSIRHCTRFNCNMCGANHREESDRRPLQLCPECVPKVWFATQCEPQDRFVKLAKFCRSHQLNKAADYYEKASTLLSIDP